MKKFLKSKAISLAILISLILSAYSAMATEFSFGDQDANWNVGKTITVPVFINTEGESINAVEGEIVFPSLLELKDINNGDSIVNFWAEAPASRSSNKISFSGITPGGYKGKNGLLFSMIFEAVKEGSATIRITGIKALKNDGEGTPAKIKNVNLQFSISGGAATPERPKVKDNNPPESFLPEVANDPFLFNGKWFLVFAAQDKGTGIAGYEVKETRQKLFSSFSKWFSSESPYALKDQELRSYIYVKAIDKSGNERVIRLSPKNPFPWYKNYKNWLIIIVGLAILYAIKKLLWRRYLKK